MTIERPNDLHAWYIYKEQWVCHDCGCCDDSSCERCGGEWELPCDKTVKD